MCRPLVDNRQAMYLSFTNVIYDCAPVMYGERCEMIFIQAMTYVTFQYLIGNFQIIWGKLGA